MVNDDQVLERLLQKRQRIVDGLVRIENFIQTINETTTAEALLVRIDSLDSTMSEFTKTEDRIMAHPSQVSQIDDFESRYLDAKAILKHMANERNAAGLDATNQLNKTMSEFAFTQKTFYENFHQFSNSHHGEVRLPHISIPSFGGNYVEFPAFKDLFESSVHTNGKLSKVHKFQYLKSSLKDEAASLIRHINVTSDNYEEAWAKVVDRYEKKRQIVTKYIKMFLDIATISKPTPTNLRQLFNTSDEVIRGLRALGSEAEQRDPWLVNILLSKLDSDTRQQWAQKTLSNDFPSIESFLKFINDRCDSFENSETFTSQPSTSKQPSLSTVKVHHSTSTTYQCPSCTDNHYLYKCPKFKSMDTSSRRAFVLQKGLCFNCLYSGHSAQVCQSKYVCHTCRGKHHTSLHMQSSTNMPNSHNQEALAKTVAFTSSIHNKIEAQPNSSPHSSSHLSPQTQAFFLSSKKITPTSILQTHMARNFAFEHLLPTAIVNVNDVHGNLQQCRILLDSGSMGNLVSHSLVHKLQLPMQRSNIIVTGVASDTTSRFKTTFTLSSRINPENAITIDAHILTQLTSVPNESFSTPHIRQFEHLELADPRFNIRSPIDIIINAGTVFSTLLLGSIKDINTSITAQNTIFGWVLAGDVNNCPNIDAPSLNMHTCIDIDKSLQLFWKSEEVHQASQLSASELQCEKLYSETVRRDKSGRFIVQLPFNESCKELGNSQRSAVSRLMAIERKLNRNPHLKSEYYEFMSEYLKLGHMEKIQPEQLYIKEAEQFYLPHHFVLKSDSITTKLRVVFDGSCQTNSGISLNQKLLVGPTIQGDLSDIILRFRMHNIVFCADIAKMYRQILIEPSHRNYQRIVWRFDPTSDIEHYRLTTVTYGTSCAPFLATRTLKQISIEGEKQFPTAAKVVAEDFYVDDLLTGADSVSQALQIQQEVVTLLESGGFSLRKWSSNSSEFMASINQSQNGRDIAIFKNDSEVIKVLGIYWQPEKDIFKYKIEQYSNDNLLTKRKFLSQSAKLFDPFGWLSPAIIKIKILYQSLWLHNLTWDEKLPNDVAEKWNAIQANLKSLESIQIPRQIVYRTDGVQLHGFCDASNAASAAVIYCKSYDKNAVSKIRLVIAKTKVAPVRVISLPRLELNGALLLSRLFRQVLLSFNKYQPTIFAWCDSEIVLAWLSDHPKRWKTYIANRTSEILDVLPRESWYHIPSSSNPADPASRGLEPIQLVENQLWWSGPEWLLRSEEEWPQSKIKHYTTLERTKQVLHSVTKQRSFIEDLCYKISSWPRLKRVIAFCLRLYYNCKILVRKRHGVTITGEQQKRQGVIIAEEQRVAEKICIKAAQRECFLNEINELTRNGNLKARFKSPLTSLAPFLDAEGILRVGGRLHNASCSYTTKHPFILHHSHILSKMIVAHHHIHFLHPSPSLLCSLLKNNFWIVGGSKLAKRESQKCVKCIRIRAQTSKQMMGTLPKPRVTQSRPFTHTGIDFAGPILLLSKRGRGARLIKGYICVFVCLSVKAIHLEVVSDMSSDAFIAAFKRFVSRRGLPSDVYTDNGTNFVGAHRKLVEIFSKEELFSAFENARLFCANQNINWNFSPPSGPHFGGIWEAAVKSMKTHLRIIAGRARLTFEEMNTLILEIECILNSRPLCAQFNEDINTLEVITPAHFLVMGPLTTIPEVPYTDVPINRLTRWQQVRQHVSSFWVKFNKEYLNTMQQRNKWKSTEENLKVNDIVIIKEDLPASYWALARVIEINPGQDGLVRVVSVKTSNAVIKRPIHKLIKLPIE